MKMTFVLLVLLLISQASGQEKPRKDLTGQGKYIVENVAMCV